jgi:ribonuclease P protein component
MSERTFSKSERLIKRFEFDKVLAGGRKKKIDRTCILYVLPNDLGRQRLGIIASKKIGNAVNRNRAKRKIREVFRRIKSRMKPTMDIVVISGKDLVSLPFSVLEKKISESLLSRR